MKTTKKILSIFLALIMIISIIPMSVFTASAEDSATSGTCGDNLTWTFDESTGTLTISGVGAMNDYDVDANKSPWWDIRGLMKKIIINNGVETIGDDAFYYCTKLTSITLPNSLKLIGDSAFTQCTKLGNITIPNSVISIGNCAFSGCESFTSVTTGNSVVTIGDYAFASCKNLTSFVISNSVTTIGHLFVYDCKKLASITVDGNNKYFSNDEYGVLFNKNKTLLIQYPMGNVRLDYTIPDSVITINDEAFYNCLNLTKVTIGKNVTRIGVYAFYNCTSLTNITFYNGVTSIGDAAFVSCTSLTDITFPDSVTSFGEGMFTGCVNLESVILSTNLISIPSGTFMSCSNLKSIVIPNSVTTIGSSAFYACTSLKSITIPNSVTIIDNYAFYDCTSLKCITIPNSVTTIGHDIARGCDNLNDVYYLGTENEWKKISINVFNRTLLNATIHYSSSDTGSDDMNCDEQGHSYNAVVTEPNYTKDGYTTYTCTLCGDSYIADYTPKTGLSFTEDIYAFKNSASNFNTGSHTILDTYFERLCDYVKTYVNPNVYDEIENNLQKFRDSEWNGSCYGMAVTVLLDKLGKIAFNENFDTDARTMYEVDSPSSNMDVMSAITYYHISQSLSFVNQHSIYLNKYFGEWSNGLKDIVEIAETGKLFIFEYQFLRGFKIIGHALIITGYKETDDGYVLDAYDCRYPGESVTVNVDKEFKKCDVIHVDNLGEKKEENVLGAKCITDFSGFDKIDIDGTSNAVSSVYSNDALSTSNTTIYFPASGDITIKNKNGDILTYSNGVLSGTMEIISENFMVNSTIYGEPGVSTMIVEVHGGKTFEVVSSSGDIDISFLTQNAFASATATNADSVMFDEDKGVYIFGENMDYDIYLTSNMSNTDMISISGKSASDVSLAYMEDAIVANGVDGENCQVTVFSDTVNVEDKNFMPGYNSVMISSSSAEYGDVDILGSSNNDGNYDISVMEGKEISFSIQSPSRTEIRNKDGIILHANVDGTAPNGSYVKWESNNSNFDKSADGSNLKIIAKNKGWTTFTAILYDVNGKELARDSVEMYSKSGFFDKIGGFFRSLFGTTKVYDA